MVNSFDAERRALVGHQDAVIRIIDNLRRYRAASKKLIKTRYQDGSVDGIAMMNFVETIKDIEDYDSEINKLLKS